MSGRDDPEARRAAYPETDLLIGPAPQNEATYVACPWCDTSVPLHGAHECVECGATFDVSVRWSR